MRGALSIWRRETLSFFVSPIAYFVIAGFGVIGAYFFFNLLAIYNFIVQRFASMPYAAAEAPSLNEWVIEQYYQTLLVILVFLIPLLTMRTFADERRRGTFELLLTSPLSVGEIVVGKFLGVATVIFGMMVLAFAFPLLTWIFLEPEVAPLFSGIAAVFLFALGFASIGMAVSAYTENQIVAAVSSMVALLLLYVIHAPAQSLGGAAETILNSLSPLMQVRDMVQGVVTVKSLMYFASLIILGQFLSFRAIESVRWR